MAAGSVTRPDEVLVGKEGSPEDWLGRNRFAELDVTEWEVRTADWSGPLRGVKQICFNRLKKATELSVAKGDVAGTYYVSAREDPEGGEWVNLSDPYADRCYCADFVFRGEDLGTPCKHILAALIADGHPGILELVEEMKRREALARAVEKPTT